ncbi:MAG TPA: iron-sulfur cluster assembly accessory protein [Candidatus Desulfobacillus sp.]|nr:iron-sulfur cluster assembly accessory protein [Candidatus Desulfobacillus sp.]
MFALTPAAAARVIDSARQSDAAGMPLRIAAKVEEDGRLAFGIGFDEPREQDLSYECEGVTLLIAPPSRELLEDMLLDFAEIAPGDWQFVFMRTSPPGGGCAPSGCGGCSSSGSCG